MTLGYNHPVGPLALAARIGLDTLLSILDDLRVAYGDAVRAPPSLLPMVDAGPPRPQLGGRFSDSSLPRAPATHSRVVSGPGH